MRGRREAQSATSLPRAPRDDGGLRARNYLITMGVRIVCLLLMVFVTPYGWHSIVFGAGAIVLPYIAVVIANAVQAGTVVDAERPEGSIESAAQGPAHPEHPVIRIEESHGDDKGDGNEAS